MKRITAICVVLMNLLVVGAYGEEPGSKPTIEFANPADGGRTIDCDELEKMLKELGIAATREEQFGVASFRFETDGKYGKRTHSIAIDYDFETIFVCGGDAGLSRTSSEVADAFWRKILSSRVLSAPSSLTVNRSGNLVVATSIGNLNITTKRLGDMLKKHAYDVHEVLLPLVADANASMNKSADSEKVEHIIKRNPFAATR